MSLPLVCEAHNLDADGGRLAGRGGEGEAS